MSRPIRFRVWDNESLKYRDEIPAIEAWWDQDAWDDAEELMEHPFVNLDVGAQFAPRLTWEQFTGLLDSTGRDIYEGDIVRHITKVEHGDACTCTDEVKWSESGLWSLGESWIVDCDIHVATFEVIGNIHENPTLLAAPALSL